MTANIKAVLIFCLTLLVIAYMFKPSRYEISSGGIFSILVDRYTGETWRLYSNNDRIAGWMLIPFKSDDGKVESILKETQVIVDENK